MTFLLRSIVTLPIIGFGFAIFYPYSMDYDSRPTFQVSEKLGEYRGFEKVAELFIYVHQGTIVAEIRVEFDLYPSLPPRAWMVIDLWVYKREGTYFIRNENTTITKILQFVFYAGMIVKPISWFLPDGWIDYLLTYFGK